MSGGGERKDLIVIDIYLAVAPQSCCYEDSSKVLCCIIGDLAHFFRVILGKPASTLLPLLLHWLRYHPEWQWQDIPSLVPVVTPGIRICRNSSLACVLFVVAPSIPCPNTTISISSYSLSSLSSCLRNLFGLGMLLGNDFLFGASI